MSNERRQRRAAVLVEFGADESQATELLDYNDNVFDHTELPRPLRLPLADEAHVETWDKYAERARTEGVLRTLQGGLPQLNFPVREGISDTEEYRAATRKGRPAEQLESATGLHLEDPQGLRLVVSESPGGRVPVLIPATRADFVTLLQALSMRNEPGTVLDTQGAVTIGGFNNWDRVRCYRDRWQAENPFDDWAVEFQRLAAHKDLYQDRFMILSVGPYGRVSAADLGLGDEEWNDTSVEVRMHHESTHYFTWRLFSSMRNRALDELAADYMGTVGAVGEFRTEWAWRFFGVHGYPHHEVGRLRRYRGSPPLSDGAFDILHGLVYSAIKNLGDWDGGLTSEYRTRDGRAVALLAITSLTVEEMAAGDGAETLAAALRDSLRRAR